jgi:rSAM/selenodomain-associated transferase 2
VIVPALDEEPRIASVLRRARDGGADEIIVVDGGSRDRTIEVARPLADQVVSAHRGRAVQMNFGAALAGGDGLLFLHADTLLPPAFATAIANAIRDGAVGGRFDVDLDPPTPLLRLVGALMNHRSRLSGIATGDQAIFVRRDVFQRLEGYSPIPLMEDIEFSRRLKRVGRLACLRQRVSTSSRRWQSTGPLRTILLMWTLRLLYFCGVPAERLRRAYTDRR